jgi:hypothetical protein
MTISKKLKKLTNKESAQSKHQTRTKTTHKDEDGPKQPVLTPSDSSTIGGEVIQHPWRDPRRYWIELWTPLDRLLPICAATLLLVLGLQFASKQVIFATLYPKIIGPIFLLLGWFFLHAALNLRPIWTDYTLQRFLVAKRLAASLTLSHKIYQLMGISLLLVSFGLVLLFSNWSLGLWLSLLALALVVLDVTLLWHHKYGLESVTGSTLIALCLIYGAALDGLHVTRLLLILICLVAVAALSRMFTRSLLITSEKLGPTVPRTGWRTKIIIALMGLTIVLSWVVYVSFYNDHMVKSWTDYTLANAFGSVMLFMGGWALMIEPDQGVIDTAYKLNTVAMYFGLLAILSGLLLTINATP